MGGATTSTISNGTLAVDFYDPQSKQLIWRGSAAPTLQPERKSAEGRGKAKQGSCETTKELPAATAEVVVARQYQWIETTQLTLKGDDKPPRRNCASTAPTGKFRKLRVGLPPQQPSGGRAKQR
jgi:hypothetical protein